MKKTIAMILTVISMLSVLGLFASAKSYENEYLSVVIPEGFSSKSEKSFGDSHYYIQWDNLDSGSNISLSYLPNEDKECFVGLSDTEMEVYRKNFIKEMNDAFQSENPYEEMKYTIVESKIYAIEIGEAKGLRLDVVIELEYSAADYKDKFNASTCLFSTEEQAFSLSCNYMGTKEKEAAESYFNSVKIKGEIYAPEDDMETGIIGFVIFGAMVGALIGLIIALRKKKKKQKMVQSGYNGAPNQFGYNGVPNQGGFNGVPNQSGFNGAPNQPGYNGAPNQFNNNDASPDLMNPNN